MVTPGIAQLGSLFPRVRASIWESCRKNAHETVARARFELQNALTVTSAALVEDEVGTVHTRLWREVGFTTKRKKLKETSAEPPHPWNTDSILRQHQGPPYP